MCKDHALSRSTNLLNKNHSTLCFCLRREGPPKLINFMIRSNCPEFSETILKKKAAVQFFENMNFVFLLTPALNSFMGSF